MLLWISIQLVPVIVAATRVPLAARYPEPAEQLAPQLLVSTQVIAAGLLFPFLLRGWRIAIQVIAVAIPFQLAAAFLAGIDVGSMWVSTASVALWLGALSLWTTTLRSQRTRAIGIALASSLTFGAGIVRYLRLEFDPSTASKNAFELASPLFTAVSAVDGAPPRAGWVLLSVFLLAGLVAAMVPLRRRATL